MDFEEYIEIVMQSAQEDGYDSFHPSLRIVSDEIHMNVLDCDLSPTGEEEIAKEWAGSILEFEDHAFLAYRVGDRMIHVVEIRERDVKNKSQIKVHPYEEEAN